MDENKIKELLTMNEKTGRMLGYLERDNRALRKSNFQKNLTICILGYVVYNLIQDKKKLNKELDALKGEKEM